MSVEEMARPMSSDQQPSGGVVRGVLLMVGVAASAVVTGLLVGTAAQSVSGEKAAAWVVGRAAGITSYLLLLALVALGLVLSHPWRARMTWPSAPTRLRLHVSLAVFTFAFIVLHVVVLATDAYAGVGWVGAFVPMGASYRPVAVTLGVISLYAGLLAGITAALAGRFAGKVWWPIHKVAIVTLVLVWTHSLMAGTDTAVLKALYLVSAVGVVALAVSRYTAKTPADMREEYLAATSGPARRALEERGR
jgi:predicted ferric reductase